MNAGRGTSKVKLYAPRSYWDASEDLLFAVTGGCGPGGVGDLLVPDTIWGLNIRRCCQIHDFMYWEGLCHADKEAADRVFLYNMLRVVQARTKNKWLRRLRVRRAKTYYEAVSTFGGPAFWDNKNDDSEMREVIT